MFKELVDHRYIKQMILYKIEKIEKNIGNWVGGMAWEKLTIKNISAQMKLKLGLSLAKIKKNKHTI